MGPNSYDHAGAGSALAFAEPEGGVAFAYMMMNRMQTFLVPDPPARGPIEAIRQAVACAFGAAAERTGQDPVDGNRGLK